MAYEQKENSGSLFKNDRKETDKHPDRSGSALIDGVEYWVSGWIKESENKGPWLSLAFKRKEVKDVKSAKPDRTGGLKNMDSDIPF